MQPNPLFSPSLFGEVGRNCKYWYKHILDVSQIPTKQTNH